jgi:hypothetical protein
MEKIKLPIDINTINSNRKLIMLGRALVSKSYISGVS